MEEAIELSARHFEILCDSSVDCHALEAIVWQRWPNNTD